MIGRRAASARARSGRSSHGFVTTAPNVRATALTAANSSAGMTTGRLAGDVPGSLAQLPLQVVPVGLVACHAQADAHAPVAVGGVQVLTDGLRFRLAATALLRLGALPPLSTGLSAVPLRAVAAVQALRQAPAAASASPRKQSIRAEYMPRVHAVVMRSSWPISASALASLARASLTRSCSAVRTYVLRERLPCVLQPVHLVRVDAKRLLVLPQPLADPAAVIPGVADLRRHLVSVHPGPLR